MNDEEWGRRPNSKLTRLTHYLIHDPNRKLTISFVITREWRTLLMVLIYQFSEHLVSNVRNPHSKNLKGLTAVASPRFGSNLSGQVSCRSSEECQKLPPNSINDEILAPIFDTTALQEQFTSSVLLSLKKEQPSQCLIQFFARGGRFFLYFSWFINIDSEIS